MTVIGNSLILLGVFFILTGSFAVNRFRNFYTRILVTSKVDTVGFLLVFGGLMVKSGVTFFSAKLLIIIIFFIITNPISTHSIVHSAYHSGFRIKKEDQ